MKKGLLISFEGVEGCGKTTQIELLEKKLISKGLEVVKYREPGGTALGEEVRSVLKTSKNPICPMAELLLFSASRAQLMETVRTDLDAGKVVILDRFIDSTIAYQAYGRGLSVHHVNQANLLATGGLKPDITLLLHVSLEVSSRRLSSRQEFDRFDEEATSFFEKVAKGFFECSQADPFRITTIDAEQTVEVVSGIVTRVVLEEIVGRLLT